MKKLSDGTIVSSTYNINPKKTLKEATRLDFSFKRGIVIAIHYPEQETNISKKFIEYDVLAVDSRADGASSSITYYRCQTMDKFGTTNNYERFTLQKTKEKKGKKFENGAQVLVLAVDGSGSAGKAVIVGGYSYPYQTTPKKDDDQFYEWQFNGINVKVNKDGEYRLTFNTPIDVSGKKKDDKAAGTVFEILKDGKLKISDNEGQYWEIDRVNQTSTWGNGQESIVLNKKDKKIDLVSSGTTSETITKSKSTTVNEKDHLVETKGGSIIEKAGKDIQQDAKSNISVKAGSSISFESGGSFNIKAGGSLSIKAGGMVSIKGSKVKMGSGNKKAAGVGISKCLGTGNKGKPVNSTIITGSSTCFIGA